MKYLVQSLIRTGSDRFLCPVVGHQYWGWIEKAMRFDSSFEADDYAAKIQLHLGSYRAVSESDAYQQIDYDKLDRRGAAGD